MDARRLLLEFFQAGLAAVEGRRCVRDHLRRYPIATPLHLIALGKAAAAMALGAHDALGPAIRSGFVVTKHGHGEPMPWPVHEAGHPLPDDASLAAGAALLAFVDALPRDARVLVLLSGGASALVEALPVGATLADLRALNEWLLASGRDIAACNRVRKRLSRLKGGRLAARLGPRPVTCLTISDVPGDDPRYIGSGPLTPDATVTREPIDDAPARLRELLATAAPVPAADDACFANVDYVVVARLADALDAIAAASAAQGVNARIMTEFVTGDAAAAGATAARALIESSAAGLFVWGGETTVTLPPNPGRGGRNQTLALAAAIAFAGRPDLYLLAAGTDGTDGPTEDAGALVDGATLERGRAEGLEAVEYLRRADAGTYLAASGDLIQTGPTGTNVMDVILGLRW